MAKVDVLINCYNGEAYLKKAIDSIIQQSFTNWNIILWDNQSTDNTKSIVDSFRDERIKYFYADRFTKLNEARVLASKHFNAEYIAILDADDIACPNRLKIQAAFLDANPRHALVGSSVIIINEKNENVKYDKKTINSENVKNVLFYKNFIYHSSVMFRKSAFTEVGGYNQNLVYSQDYDLWLKFCGNWNIAILPEFLAKYRIHNGSITNNRQMVIRNSKDDISNLTNASRFISPTWKSWFLNKYHIGRLLLKILVYSCLPN